ncbi:MAG: hypothetical protein WBD45_09940 [Terriglobales bacterium]
MAAGKECGNNSSASALVGTTDAEEVGDGALALRGSAEGAKIGRDSGIGDDPEDPNCCRFDGGGESTGRGRLDSPGEERRDWFAFGSGIVSEGVGVESGALVDETGNGAGNGTASE